MNDRVFLFHTDSTFLVAVVTENGCQKWIAKSGGLTGKLPGSTSKYQKKIFKWMINGTKIHRIFLFLYLSVPFSCHVRKQFC